LRKFVIEGLVWAFDCGNASNKIADASGANQQRPGL
jgi:hypothetical protein